jgi:hypothetical protein
MPLDQRIDDAGSLVFDSAPLDAPLNLVGDPVALLELAADQPQALVAVRLSDVAPDGAVTRVTYGLLNLSHRDGHGEPAALEPERRYRVRVRLNEAGHRFAAGHRLRVAISSSYWPMAWPAPAAATLSLTAGDSLIELPILPEAAVRTAAPFEPVEYARPLRMTQLRAGGDSRTITHDVATGRTTVRVMRDDGCNRIDDIGTEVAYTKLKEMSIVEGDPLSMREEVAVSHAFRRDDWDARLETRIVMTCDIRHFILKSDLDAYAGGARLFSRSFHHRIPRDHL